LATEGSERLDQKLLLERLDMLDHRLDNMDSIITTLVERVMKQPLLMYVTCPSCGKTVEVSIMGNTRLGKGGNR
jgi:hypothetical protein